jgi:head-tail adaptor
MGKRAFLKIAATGAVAGATLSCSDQKKDPNNAIPPFAFGATTYRLIDLKDYNGALPPSGMNLAVVGYVQNDFYFRYFDEQGRLAVNQHESKVTDAATLSEMKVLASSLAAKGDAEPSEQSRFAQLFSAVRSDAEKSQASSGRRMQGSDARLGVRGRRMQRSAAGGTVSGKRMQGAEGRVEAGSPQRNLGTLLVNNERYTDSRIAETYADGYTKLAYAGGVVVVRTDALPEVVRLQLPHPIANPSPKPSAVPRTTTTVVPAAPVAPAEPSRPLEREPSHYWRPN